MFAALAEITIEISKAECKDVISFLRVPMTEIQWQVGRSVRAVLGWLNAEGREFHDVPDPRLRQRRGFDPSQAKDLSHLTPRALRDGVKAIA